MNWSRIATDRMRPEDCLVFSDWLLDQGEDCAAVGLRRMVRDGKWPKVLREGHWTGTKLIPRVAARWFSVDDLWVRSFQGNGLPLHHWDIHEEYLPRTMNLIEPRTKTFWRKSGWFRWNEVCCEAKDPVAAALEFGAHLFGGLPEEAIIA